ncbi:hypothetical protein AYL99_05943 [Fonsecaea erecta]|uniref:C2H2-type domain-containing protein n=1 Tax=Fonsecaea erecta TaxID=1367422 RepID=A0A178ZN97_9EURO|nr:hypothetical protein AYL99_05943 [Fonsecaea erecta]OAP60941.1 hypothetical protein AYL99_05943 [Fonsecaea erecta]
MSDFNCSCCGKPYQSRRTLYRHYRDDHPEHTGGQSSNPSWAVVNSGGSVQSPRPCASHQGNGVVASPAAAAAVAFPSVPSTPSPPLIPRRSVPRGGNLMVNHPSQQLRSSRSTRNQENNPTPRNRAGLPDFDVTEGLPVQRWEYTRVKVNQDASADHTDGNNQSTENQDSSHSWPELPLPSFWPQLPPANQELVRRARMGNVNPKLSVWDPKTESYIPGIELERREAARKAQVNKTKLNPTANVDAMNVDDDEDKNDEENDDLMDVEGLAPDSKRRKANSGSNERVFEVKKWVQVPVALAERMPEPKYLADRRPGMESLYKGAYKATNGFGTLGDAVAAAMSNGAAGYDLGDGGGLGNAAGILAPGSGSRGLNTQADGTSTPARKNLPPRRKKKKLGGPGRKPKNPNPGQPAATSAIAPAALESAATEDTAAASTVEGDVTMRNTPETAVEGADNADATPAIQGESVMHDADAEGSGSESEGEGSEEGEIAATVDHPPTENTTVVDPPLTEHATITDPAPPESITTIDPTLTEDTVATQITPKPVEEEVVPEEDGAPEEHKKEDTEEKDVKTSSPVASPERPKAEADVSPDADAAADAVAVTATDAVFTPVIDQEAKKEGRGEDEIDVLSALENAVDKEVSEDV